MTRPRGSDLPPELFELYDRYAHGRITRRDFLDGAARFAVGGLTAAALLDRMKPDYALAQQVPEGDARIRTEYVTYPSPDGHGEIRALLARPSTGEGPFPGVVVVHENRGLNPYIEDVARRLGAEGFLALAPDGLTPVGGYPGDDDRGRELQATLDGAKLMEDFVAAAVHLMAHPECTGRVGVVGFCYGGLVSHTLAIRLPELAASVPFYGRQPSVDGVPRIQAPLLIHFAEDDPGVNGGWPDYEAALQAHGKPYEAHFYPGTLHGFHNDTTPRYDPEAAALAWERTVAFFRTHLGA
jgi:carboxymethylenebutenolidase